MNVLLVAEETETRHALERFFRARGDEVAAADRVPPPGGGYGCVVVDLALGQEALEVCHRAREGNGHGIVLALARGDRSPGVALEAGADDVVRVPLDPGELEQRLRVAADRRATLAASRERLMTLEHEHRRTEEALRRERAFFEQLFRSSPNGIAILDDRDRIVDANEPFCELFQYPLGELVGHELSERIVPDELRAEAHELSQMVFHKQSVERETVRQRKDGSRLDVIILGYPIELADRRIGAYGIYTDVTARKRAERELFHEAFHDPLTGLPNRSMLIDRLERALQRTRRGDYHFALLFLDLDGFKTVNDRLGHAAGDELLVEIARRVESCLRPGDATARLGGDELMIILEGIGRTSDATRIVERVLERIREPYRLADEEVRISASIGIAFSATGYPSADVMMRDADLAMYRAKAAGKDRYAIFDQAMHRRMSERCELERELRRAIDEGALLLDYQPIVALGSGRVVAFEALVRWHHPERGRIEPRELIPIAEESGLIVPLGRWALTAACRRVIDWQERFPEHDGLVIHVNVSSREIARSGFFRQVQEVLATTGAKASAIGLELGEQALWESDAELLWRLHNLGLRIQVDDFGTGSSSIGALQSLPLDSLKIDRSFVRTLAPGDASFEIVRAIAALGESLGLLVVAEGVETDEQLRLLRKLAVPCAQGYRFSRPLPADAAAALIARDPSW